MKEQLDGSTALGSLAVQIENYNTESATVTQTKNNDNAEKAVFALNAEQKALGLQTNEAAVHEMISVKISEEIGLLNASGPS